MKRLFLYSVCGLLLTTLISFNVMKVKDQEILIGHGTAQSSFNVTINNLENRRNAILVNNNANFSTGGGTAIQASQKVMNGQCIAVRAIAAEGTTQNTQAHSFGVRASAGNGADGFNFGVYGELGVGYGAGVYGTMFTALNPAYYRYAGFFEGNAYISERLGIGKRLPNHALDVQGSIAYTGSIHRT